MAGERKSEERELPPTCEVRGWVVFRAGFAKGDNYSPAMVLRVPQNFELLKDHLTPTAKLGHDKQQRLSKSLGFPNVGKITKCVPVGNDAFAIDVTGIPTSVGGEINAGRLNSGSVELLPSLPNPDDPAKKIDGPIVSAVSFLGEEQPAVKGFKPPRAVFADGTEVPPNKDPAEWFSAMAKVTRKMAAEVEEDTEPGIEFAGRWYSATAIAFSEMSNSEGTMPEKVPVETPVPAIKMSAKGFAAFASTFADMPPDEGKKFAASCKKYSEGGKMEDIEKEHPGFSAKFSSYADAPTAESTPPVAPAAAPGGGTGAMPQETPMGAEAMMAACKKFAEDPAATPEQKMMAAMYSDMTKRMGAMEAEKEAEKKQTGEVQMAQFSAMVEERIKKIARKVPPVTINSLIRPTALAIGQKKTFAAGSSMTVELNDLFKPFESMKEDDRLATTEAKPVTGTDGKPVPINEAPVNDPSGLLTRWASRDGILDRENSTGAKHLRRRIVQG